MQPWGLPCSDEAGSEAMLRDVRKITRSTRYNVVSIPKTAHVVQPSKMEIAHSSTSSSASSSAAQPSSSFDQME